MSFISYAQNHEDVLLWRALGHVARGFYIDAGANDPVTQSVTKAFYDAGWSGINIEPLPALHQLLAEQRPRDINLALAVGASAGSLTLYDIPAVNGWATPDADVAAAHQSGGFDVTELQVPVRTLAAICEEHAPAAIHFLKIDVEGFEGQVLSGMDFTRWRPWVVVVEATLPNSRVLSHERWEPLLLAGGYTFTHFDGLNRYYVAHEHGELIADLSVQPNVFDDYISCHVAHAWAAQQAAQQAEQQASLFAEKQARARLQQLHGAEKLAARAERRRRLAERQAFDARAAQRDAERRAREADKRAEQARRSEEQQAAHLQELQHWARDLEQRLLGIHASSSWRFTEPLRQMGALGRRHAPALYRARARALLRRAVLHATASEPVRRVCLPILLRFPTQAARVAALLRAIRQVQPDSIPVGADLPDEQRAMPPRARRVLADLQRARHHARDGTP